MTSLVSWVGVDCRGASSAYFATDSRITWPGNDSWDYGRKLFACKNYPHILGYCGDVLFPTQALSQLTDMIDSGLLLGESDNIDTCVKRIAGIISQALSSYPTVGKQDFEILYCMREGAGMRSRFHMRRLKFKSNSEPQITLYAIPQNSAVVETLGSGKTSISAKYKTWQATDVAGTSRAVFSSFCDSLRSLEDPKSGGPPQLVGLWRTGGAKIFGVIWNKKRYFYGVEVNSIPTGSKVRWYNELFEICDPDTLARSKGSQPQPRPKGL